MFIEKKTKMKPIVSIIMGSTSNLPIMKKAAEFLNSMEIPFEMNALSAHRTPEQARDFALNAIGINAEIRTYDESSWLDLRKAGDMDSFIANWTMDYNDPANIMYTFFGSEEKTVLRSLNYADADIMARVASASSITDDQILKYLSNQNGDNGNVYDVTAIWRNPKRIYKFRISGSVMVVSTQVIYKEE